MAKQPPKPLTSIKAALERGEYDSFSELLTDLCKAPKNLAAASEKINSRYDPPLNNITAPNMVKLVATYLGDFPDLIPDNENAIRSQLAGIKKLEDPLHEADPDLVNMAKAALYALGFDAYDLEDGRLINAALHLPGKTSKKKEEKPSTKIEDGNKSITVKEVFAKIERGEYTRSNFTQIGSDLNKATGLTYAEILRRELPDDKKGQATARTKINIFFRVGNVSCPILLRETATKNIAPAAKQWGLTKKQTSTLVDLRLELKTPSQSQGWRGY